MRMCACASFLQHVFMGLALRAHNSTLEFKLNVAFCNSEKGLSNDVLRSGIRDYSKLTIFA